MTVISEGPSDGPEVEKFDTVNVYARRLVADGTQFEDNLGTDTRRPIVIGERPGRRPRKRVDRSPTG